MNYPEMPTANGYQTLGQLLSQGGQLVNQYNDAQTADEDRQLRLQALRQDMIDKRTAAAMARIKADREAKLEQEKEARAAASADFAKGEVISPTLAKDPSLARSVIPIVPNGPTQQELDSLEIKDGSVPSQSVSGNSPTALMGQALDRMVGSGSPGRVPRTREEILQNQLENRQITADDWAKATKPEKPEYKWNNDPTLAADFRTQAQDPTFQKLAEGYAKNPQKFGPALQNWAARRGYAGQVWWNQEVDNMVHQSPFQLANKDATTPEEIDYWAKQYADGKVDPQTLSGMFSSRGGNKANIMGKIVRKAQSLNSNVDVSKDIADFGSSKNQKNKGTIATIDNVRSRMDRIAELSNSINRTNFPTFNKFLLSGERGVGDLKANMLKLNEDLTGEELNQVFGGGTAGSDAKLKLAQEISSLGDLPVDVAVEKIKEINGALDTRKNTFLNQMGRYGSKSPNSNNNSVKTDFRKKYNY